MLTAGTDLFADIKRRVSKTHTHTHKPLCGLPGCTQTSHNSGENFWGPGSLTASFSGVFAIRTTDITATFIGFTSHILFPWRILQQWRFLELCIDRTSQGCNTQLRVGSLHNITGLVLHPPDIDVSGSICGPQKDLPGCPDSCIDPEAGGLLRFEVQHTTDGHLDLLIGTSNSWIRILSLDIEAYTQFPVYNPQLQALDTSWITQCAPAQVDLSTALFFFPQKPKVEDRPEDWTSSIPYTSDTSSFVALWDSRSFFSGHVRP